MYLTTISNFGMTKNTVLCINCNLSWHRWCVVWKLLAAVVYSLPDPCPLPTPALMSWHSPRLDPLSTPYCWSICLIFYLLHLESNMCKNLYHFNLYFICLMSTVNERILKYHMRRLNIEKEGIWFRGHIDPLQAPYTSWARVIPIKILFFYIYYSRR